MLGEMDRGLYTFSQQHKTLVWSVKTSNVVIVGNPVGIKDNYGYYKRKIKLESGDTVNVKIHRFLFYYWNGWLPEYVDHINRDETDNSKENLRAADKSLNQRNQKLRADNSSGYKGVSFCKNIEKWGTRLKIEGKYKVILYSCDLLKAAAAYNYALNLIYGADFDIFKNPVNYEDILDLTDKSKVVSNLEKVGWIKSSQLT